MAEIVNCPQCDRKLRVPDELLGKKVKCPTCGTTFTAEVEEAPPPPPPAPRYEPRSPLGPPAGVGRRRDEDEEEYDEDDHREAALDRPRRRRRDVQPHRGALILVLGILSLVTCPLLGPIAWVLGNNDLAEMRSGRMDPEGESQTKAGRICGIIGTVLIGLNFCCGMMWIMFAILGALADQHP